MPTRLPSRDAGRGPWGGGTVALAALLAALGACAGDRPRAEEPRPPLPGYGLFAPCDSPDPSGRNPCVEAGLGAISVRIRLSLPAGPDEAGRRVWLDVTERRGEIERCHLDAAALDPALECAVVLVATVEGPGGPRLEVEPSRTDCPPPLVACIEPALSRAAAAEDVRLVAEAAAEPPALLLSFAPSPRPDPRSGD